MNQQRIDRLTTAETGEGAMRVSRSLWLALVLGLSLLVVPTTGVAQGNSGNAHACKDGEYGKYHDGSGVPFQNQGECVKFAAQGNELVPVATARITVLLNTIFQWPDWQGGGFYQVFSFEMTGFEPGSYITLSVSPGVGEDGTVLTSSIPFPFEDPYLTYGLWVNCGFSGEVGSSRTVTATDGTSTAFTEVEILC